MKTSIIIPTIGRAELKEVLNALIAQENFDPADLEVLVIFDGVGNEIFQENEEKFPSFKFLMTGKKIFAGGARNLGLDNAQGEIIVFLGDDIIPDKNFLAETQKFHLENPETNIATIGKVVLPEELKNDEFQNWAHANVQFRRTKTQSWRNFQTANSSIKREFIGTERFDENFQNWGFEDSEFWFRLEEKNGILIFSVNTKVTHDHFLTLEKIIDNTRNARKNAKYFERKHIIKILPHGFKLNILKFLVFLAGLCPQKHFPKIYWWRVWKLTWIGKN